MGRTPLFPRYIFAVALCSELLMAEPELLKEKRSKFIEIKTCNPVSGKMLPYGSIDLLPNSQSHMTPGRANSRPRAHLSVGGIQ